MWTFISTNLRMQSAGENISQSHTHTHAAKPKHIAKYFLSSEAQAVPPGRQCHQREHEAGTACPCRSRSGWLGCSRTQAVLYPKRWFSCWRLNCRLSPLPLPAAVHECCPDGKQEPGRDLPLFPLQLQSDGQKNHSPLLKRPLLPHRRAFHPSDRE